PREATRSRPPRRTGDRLSSPVLLALHFDVGSCSANDERRGAFAMHGVHKRTEELAGIHLIHRRAGGEGPYLLITLLVRIGEIFEHQRPEAVLLALANLDFEIDETFGIVERP